MAAPWAAGCQVRIVGQLHGQVTNNVMHFATNTVINDVTERDALILALLAAAMSCVEDQLKDAITSDWSLTHLEGRAIYPEPGDPIIQLPIQPTVGAMSAASVSFASSMLQIRTGVGGRTGRGRLFLPPPGEGETTGSISSQAVFDELIEFVTCVVNKFVGANATEDWRLGVLSRKILAGNPNNFDQAFREATTLVPVRTLAVMSRRRIGRGT